MHKHLPHPPLSRARTCIATTRPLGRWVTRTAELVVFTCWPPAPPALRGGKGRKGGGGQAAKVGHHPVDAQQTAEGRQVSPSCLQALAGLALDGQGGGECAVQASQRPKWIGGAGRPAAPPVRVYAQVLVPYRHIQLIRLRQYRHRRSARVHAAACSGERRKGPCQWWQRTLRTLCRWACGCAPIPPIPRPPHGA
jgi:hypothetical protein